MHIHLNNVRDMYNTSKSNAKKEIKKASDEKLQNILRCIQQEKSNHSDWEFAAKVYRELSIRPYARNNPDQIKAFRKDIGAHTNATLLSPEYAIESVGVATKKHQKGLRHVYTHSDSISTLVEQWQKSSSSKPLDKYISKNLSSKDQSKIKKRHVTYLDKSAYKHHKVTFNNGNIYIGKKSPTAPEVIFALDKKGKLLLAAEKERGHFHHSSFFCGAPVQSAGYFKIKNGKLERVLLESGHYKPTKTDGDRLRSFLSKNEHLGKKAADKLNIVTI